MLESRKYINNRRIKMDLVIVLLMSVLLTGCGAKDQEIVPTPALTPVSTPAPTPLLTREASDSVFVANKGVWEKPDTGLKEDLAKKDAAWQAEYNGMNRMISSHSDVDEMCQSLFCVDADTGASYFVNKNKDFYIYRIKDGAAELAVAMPAKELYAYGGSLYFMAESYGKYKMGDIKDGDIYCYTPKDGTIELVYAAGKQAEEENGTTCRLWVDENGVYFCYSKVDANIDSYYLPFGSGEPVKDPLHMAAFSGWRNYFFGWFVLQGQNSDSRPPLGLMSRTEGSKDFRELSIGLPWEFCVMGDKLYYVKAFSNATGILTLDLLTDEQETYSIWEELKKIYYVPTGAERSEEDFMFSDEELTELLEGELSQRVMVKSFTATEQYFWAVVNSSYLVRIDRETKEVAYFKMNNGIDVLYTDGKQLYAMCAPTLRGVFSMAKIVMEEVLYDEFMGTEYLAVEYLTE